MVPVSTPPAGAPTSAPLFQPDPQFHANLATYADSMQLGVIGSETVDLIEDDDQARDGACCTAS